MSVARPLPVPPDPETTDHFVYLHVSWHEYEALLRMRGERSAPRITYLKGLVELMSPSRFHESDRARFARLLEAWAERTGVALEGYGSWTLENAREERGAEADECYTVGRVAASDEDRPDLAIEVVWTSGGINKLDVYRKLGVSEVWFYERGSLRFFRLRTERADGGEERYEEIPTSELLPQLPRDLFLVCMAAPDQTAALRTLRAELDAHDMGG
jgi:Uma2 family endonuclease